VVVANDSDVETSVDAATVDLDPSSSGIQTSMTTTHGSWTVSNTGIVTFVPAENFNGTASLAYKVNDDADLTSNEGLINITVTAVNDAPVVANVNLSTNEDTALDANVFLPGDKDPDGTNLTVTTIPVAGPSNGTLLLNANGTFKYTPDKNYTGIDEIEVTICDNGSPVPSQCVTKKIIISVIHIPGR
jgi:hypothetical protein